MDQLSVVFRTASEIEARVVRGLLETHGIPSLVSSDLSRSIFPLAVEGLGDVKISVRPDDADEATRVIESYRTEAPGGRVIPLRNEFDALERRLGYRFRDPGLPEHALTHTSWPTRTSAAASSTTSPRVFAMPCWGLRSPTSCSGDFGSR